MSEPHTRRVLVTGGDGFVGRHLVAELRRAGHEVAMTVRPGRGAGTIAGDAVRRFEVELPDAAAILAAVREAQPDAVVHLAAVSFLPDAERDPVAAVRSNVESTRALLEALDAYDPARRSSFVLASTSHVYRVTRGAGALDESTPLGPETLYGRTKLAAELVAACLAAPGGERAPRPLVVYRCFNHTGPGQDSRFVLANFARQLVRVERGEQDAVIEAGNLDVERDFTDVRDVAVAYRLAAEGRVPPGVYNVASGDAVSLRRALELGAACAGVEVRVSCPERLRRAGEVLSLCGSAAKLERACGWRAQRTIPETIADLVEWWRHALGQPEVREA